MHVKDREGEDYGFLSGYDLSFHCDYHWAELMKLPSVLDVYSGASIGLRTGALQVGLRYNFSETFGLYAQVKQNIFKTFGEDSDHPAVYKGKTALSLGMTPRPDSLTSPLAHTIVYLPFGIFTVRNSGLALRIT